LRSKPFDLQVAFGDQAFDVPVDRPDGHAQPRRQAGLRNIRVLLDLVQQGQRAEFLFQQWHLVSLVHVGLRTGEAQNSTIELYTEVSPRVNIRAISGISSSTVHFPFSP
jgi:hypothetical protein